MPRRWTMALFALATAGCSWSRFDDVGKNTPVVLLEKPDKMHAGFGVTVASVSTAKQTRVIVGGANGKNIAAMFELGAGTDPNTAAVDTGSCSDSCYLADRLAGLAVADVGARDPESMCFVLGIGTGDPSGPGLTGRCADGTEYPLAVPPKVLKDLIKDEVIFQDAPAPLVFATDKDDGPALIAGAKDQKLAWFYAPVSIAPKQLVPPSAPDSDFGAAVAVVRLGGTSRILAVAAPESGHVWLFSGDTGEPVGCLGGPSQFGRSLVTGHVDGDDADDLVIADASNVTVISGTALAGLAPATDITCSLAALPSGGILTSFGCGSQGTIGGCPGGFGAALEVGDLDADGDGEVIVGAPDMKVRGISGAGAVLVYDAEGPDPTALSDELFLSSASSDDHLGSALATAHVDGRDVVVAGAPGNGRAAIFYCSSLLGAAGGERCR